MVFHCSIRETWKIIKFEPGVNEVILQFLNCDIYMRQVTIYEVSSLENRSGLQISYNRYLPTALLKKQNIEKLFKN